MGNPELGGDITNLVSSLGGHAEDLCPGELNEEDKPPYLDLKPAELRLGESWGLW